MKYTRYLFLHYSLLVVAGRFAIRSISRAPLRSSLTALGMVIAVASVIAMIGVGSGAKSKVEVSLQALDANEIVLSHRLKTKDGNYQLALSNDGLKIDDYISIKEAFVGKAITTPQLHVVGGDAASVSANGRNIRAGIIGADVGVFEIESSRVVSGSTFGQRDINAAASICVISRQLAQELFDATNPLGRVLYIRRAPFRVIGVVDVATTGNYLVNMYRGGEPVFIPYTSLLRRIDRRSESTMQIVIQAKHPSQLEWLKQAVVDLMEQRRGSRKAEFSLINVSDTVEAYTNSSRTLALLLAAISAISLVVGGVGIANIMLANVAERTHEIGVRIAIGAHSSDILKQMLIEAVVLSVLGGCIGIVVGLVAARIVSQWNDWPLLVTSPSVAGAFLLSIGVGIIAGYYPARRATQLNPIEALRAD